MRTQRFEMLIQPGMLGLGLWIRSKTRARVIFRVSVRLTAMFGNRVRVMHLYQLTRLCTAHTRTYTQTRETRLRVTSAIIGLGGLTVYIP